MTNSEALNSKQAAHLFSETFGDMCSSDRPPNISKAWKAFNVFCTHLIKCAREGFIFHAGFVAHFPDGERTLDYTAYQVSFTRYWYEPGEDSDTAYVAEYSLTFLGNNALRKYEWIDIDVDADGELPEDHQLQLDSFIMDVDELDDLWALLLAATASGVESYCGPQ